LYLREITKHPHLEPSQELDLARRWRDHHDQTAADTLVTSHLALIVKIALSLRGYGLPLAELVAEGNVGMIRAVVRFDPDRGTRLSTYAMWWIRATILEYVVQSSSIVRVCTTPRHRRLFFKLRKIKGRLHAMEEGDLAPETVTTIARELDVSEADVVTMNRRLSGPDVSLNAPIADEGVGEWQELLVDPAKCIEASVADRQELKIRLHSLQEAMVHLDARERAILTARRLREPPLKLSELAVQYGVSRERIRQIENRAFEKLQQRINPTDAGAERAPAPRKTMNEKDGAIGFRAPHRSHRATDLNSSPMSARHEPEAVAG
jgi:RNA polymerase sigma-32 factor